MASKYLPFVMLLIEVFRLTCAEEYLFDELKQPRGQGAQQVFQPHRPQPQANHFPGLSSTHLSDVLRQQELLRLQENGDRLVQRHDSGQGVPEWQVVSEGAGGFLPSHPPLELLPSVRGHGTSGVPLTAKNKNATSGTGDVVLRPASFHREKADMLLSKHIAPTSEQKAASNQHPRETIVSVNNNSRSQTTKNTDVDFSSGQWPIDLATTLVNMLHHSGINASTLSEFSDHLVNSSSNKTDLPANSTFGLSQSGRASQRPNILSQEDSTTKNNRHTFNDSELLQLSLIPSLHTSVASGSKGSTTRTNKAGKTINSSRGTGALHNSGVGRRRDEQQSLRQRLRSSSSAENSTVTSTKPVTNSGTHRRQPISGVIGQRGLGFPDGLPPPEDVALKAWTPFSYHSTDRLQPDGIGGFLARPSPGQPNRRPQIPQPVKSIASQRMLTSGDELQTKNILDSNSTTAIENITAENTLARQEQSTLLSPQAAPKANNSESKLQRSPPELLEVNVNIPTEPYLASVGIDSASGGTPIGAPFSLPNNNQADYGPPDFVVPSDRSHATSGVSSIPTDDVIRGSQHDNQLIDSNRSVLPIQTTKMATRQASRIKPDEDRTNETVTPMRDQYETVTVSTKSTSSPIAIRRLNIPSQQQNSFSPVEVVRSSTEGTSVSTKLQQESTAVVETTSVTVDMVTRSTVWPQLRHHHSGAERLVNSPIVGFVLLRVCNLFFT